MSATVAGAYSGALVLLTAVGVRVVASGRRRGILARRLTAPAGRAGFSAGRWRLAPPDRVRRRLHAAGVAGDPAAAWTLSLACIVAATVATTALAGVAAAAVVLAGSAAGPFIWLHVRRRRGDARYEAALPGAVEAVARNLRSGAGLVESLAAAAHSTGGSVGADLDWVVAAARRHGTVVSALDGWTLRRPLPAVRLVGAALCLGAETGGAHARAVDGIARTLRQRLDVAAEVRALSSQARASGILMALAPLAFAGLAIGGDTGTAAFLFGDPLGLAMLAAGLALDAAGILWMARLSAVES